MGFYPFLPLFHRKVSRVGSCPKSRGKAGSGPTPTTRLSGISRCFHTIHRDRLITRAAGTVLAPPRGVSRPRDESSILLSKAKVCAPQHKVIALTSKSTTSTP